MFLIDFYIIVLRNEQIDIWSPISQVSVVSVSCHIVDVFCWHVFSLPSARFCGR